MTMKSTSNHYGFFPTILHWIIAVLIIGLLIVGLQLSTIIFTNGDYNLFRMHQVVGLVVFVLTLVRIAWWLWFDKKPVMPVSTPAYQIKLSVLAHLTLTLLPLVMVVSGMVMTQSLGIAADENNLITLEIPVNYVEGAMGDFIYDQLPATARRALLVHNLSFLLLAFTLAVHVLAALYHHFIAKDDILKRMLWFRG